MPDPDEAPEPTTEPIPEPIPEPTRQQSGRARLLGALRRPARTQLVVAVLLALVGFGAITQIRTTEEDSSYAGLREQDLIDVLNGLSGTTQRTQAEIEQLQQARDDLRTESTQRRAALDRAQQEVDALNVLAGLVPVTGPGIRMTITEETGEVSVGAILDVVQELRSVGAEAIQINGVVRVVAESSFEDGSGGLLVDGTLVEPPYVIDAIGVPSALAGAMRFAAGPLYQLRQDGADATVEELATLDIEAVREPASADEGSATPTS